MPSIKRYNFRWAALAVICLSVLIINVDNTILNVALPTLVRKLHATSSGLQWIVDSYAMVFAGLLLVAGSLADRFGRKLLFLVGLAIFAGGSTAAALSGSVHSLIVWRTVMGAGAAMLIPASLSTINNIFTKPSDRAKAIGIWAGTVGIGIAIGPIAGGLLLSRFWWGSIFLVNVPIAALGFIGAMLLVPNSKNSKANRPDFSGAILSILGLGLLLWAIIEAPVHGWTSGSVVTVGLASLIVLGAFIGWEHLSQHPMLKLNFFRERRFSIAALAELLGIFGLMGALFIQTQFLQFDLSYSPLAAGLRILPVAAMIVVSAPLSPLVARILNVKLTVAGGLAAVSAGLWQISTLSTVHPTFVSILPGMLLIGLGSGLMMPTATNSLIGSVPREESGVGSATNSVAFQVGGALGVAVIGSILATRYQSRIKLATMGYHIPVSIMHTISSSLGGALGIASGIGGSRGALLAHAARMAFMSGFRVSLAVGSLVALGGILLVIVFLPKKPSKHVVNLMVRVKNTL
jgi:EmrB/QacA subfamily drug resistance transporter